MGMVGAGLHDTAKSYQWCHRGSGGASDRLDKVLGRKVFMVVSGI